MQITVKLFATLGRFAPTGGTPGTPFFMEVPEGARVQEVLQLLNLPEEEVKVAYVNGRRREPDFILQEGDTIGIFPPVGGG